MRQRPSHAVSQQRHQEQHHIQFSQDVALLERLFHSHVPLQRMTQHEQQAYFQRLRSYLHKNETRIHLDRVVHQHGFTLSELEKDLGIHREYTPLQKVVLGAEKIATHPALHNAIRHSTRSVLRGIGVLMKKPIKSLALAGIVGASGMLYERTSTQFSKKPTVSIDSSENQISSKESRNMHSSAQPVVQVTKQEVSKSRVSKPLGASILKKVGIGTLNKIPKDKIQLSEIHNPEDVYTITKAVFGDSYGAQLLIAIDKKFGKSGEVCKRMIALGLHEGELKFGRENLDPASGYNFGTFQIGGRYTTKDISLAKYNRNLVGGIKLYNNFFDNKIKRSDITTAADKDVLAHLGYIVLERDWAYGRSHKSLNILQSLANPKLSDEDLRDLMSHWIQGGIVDIGNDVVEMTRKGTLLVNRNINIKKVISIT